MVLMEPGLMHTLPCFSRHSPKSGASVENLGAPWVSGRLVGAVGLAEWLNHSTTNHRVFGSSPTLP